MRLPAPNVLARAVLGRAVLGRAVLGLVLLVVLAGCSGSPAPAAAPAPPPPTPTSAAPQPCSASTGIESYSDALDTATLPSGAPVGNLSGLTTLPNGNVLALSDRSVLVTLDPAADRALSSVPLVDPGGKPLDAEAITLDIDGTVLVTDETGPQVLRYTTAGNLLAALLIPPEFAVAPTGRAEPNATFEGLALLPDGNTLVASMEEPLAGDDPGYVRLTTWTRSNPSQPLLPGPQYALAKPAGLGISEIATAGDGRLLVLERGYEPDTGNTVDLVAADLRGATDVSRVTVLNARTAGTPVRTTVLADLGACPTLGATAKQPQLNPLLDNIEGMTVTSPTFGGPLDLLLVSDDNDNPKQVTRTYRLRTTLP